MPVFFWACLSSFIVGLVYTKLALRSKAKSSGAFVVISQWLFLTTLATSLILGNSGLLFSLLTPLDVSASQGS